jgi:recombination protein RecA
MKEVICNLIYGQGFRRDMDLILSAREAGVIKPKGSWLEYKGESIGQGINAAVEYSKTHENFLNELEEALYGDKPTTGPEPVSSDPPPSDAPGADESEPA